MDEWKGKNYIPLCINAWGIKMEKCSCIKILPKCNGIRPYCCLVQHRAIKESNLSSVCIMSTPLFTLESEVHYCQTVCVQILQLIYTKFVQMLLTLTFDFVALADATLPSVEAF